MDIAARIPNLSDAELSNLHANATRLAHGGAGFQKVQAEELLPLLGAAMEERRVSRLTAKREAAAASPRKPAAKRAAKRA